MKLLMLFKYIDFSNYSFSSINYFKQSSLIREIAQLEPPVRFLDEVRFDSLVQKYVPLGIEKEHAIRQLESYGLDIIKSDEVPRLLECEQWIKNMCTQVISSKISILFLHI